MGYDNPALIRALASDLVAVMPTDTIYGLVGRAQSVSAVNRIYEIRKRAPDKPCIVLISGIADLGGFGVRLSPRQESEIRKYWAIPDGAERPFSPAPDKPRAVSIILDCPHDKFAYLHRGTRTLAFRVPAPERLRELLRQTGPLIAPSANPEGLPPARTIAEARQYFGGSVDVYEDGGEIGGEPSKVMQLHPDGSVTIIRP